MPRIIGDLAGLITAIEHRARAEVQSREKQAEQQAIEILDKARQAADETRQQILDRANRRAETEQRQQRAEAIRAAQQNYLQSREALLNRVWQEAEAQLRALPSEENEEENKAENKKENKKENYVKVLERLTRLAAQTLGGGRLLLAADAAGHELLTDDRLARWSEAAGAALEAEVLFERAADPLDTWGGLLARQKESRRQVDLTFPTRLALAREEMREQIFERLGQTE